MGNDGRILNTNSRCVALLRGVNVGGRQRVPMADLRALLAGLGAVEVRTLLNSGNAVFGAAAGAPARSAAKIEGAIRQQLGLDVPVIYAGNVENQDEIALMAEESGVRLYITENVYPRVDQLNVDPARRIIQKVFEDHIVHAPGMNTVRDMIDGPIIPTPGAVMEAAILLRESLGDLVVFDIGGATTDVHSVIELDPENSGLAREVVNSSAVSPPRSPWP